MTIPKTPTPKAATAAKIVARNKAKDRLTALLRKIVAGLLAAIGAGVELFWPRDGGSQGSRSSGAASIQGGAVAKSSAGVAPKLVAGLIGAAAFLAIGPLAVLNHGPLAQASGNDATHHAGAFDFTQEYSVSCYCVTSFHNQPMVGAPAGTFCDQSGPVGFGSPGQGHLAISNGLIKINDENYNSGFDIDQGKIDASGHFAMKGNGYYFTGEIHTLPGHTLPAPVEPQKNIYDDGPGPKPVATGTGTWISTWATGSWCEPVFKISFNMIPIKVDPKSGAYTILPITGPSH